ncbi:MULTISPECIES: hypothetical protein [Paraburkholderia]|uniref:Uncharacterized protein n=2 Tax=Paraburkholderia TaxID=1822464 RepID=A0A7Z0B2C6_9BURK|nr:hypothetical protein [Paraburkholderia bryophila]NYH18846.1 hypothetical protein [Paraburkholderia bryophila]
MSSTTPFAVRAFAFVGSLGILMYGTRELAFHQHLHIAYLALTALGVVTGTLFTGRWSHRA